MAVIEDTNALSRQECEEIRDELSRADKESVILFPLRKLELNLVIHLIKVLKNINSLKRL